MPPYKPPPSGDLAAKGKEILRKVYTECRKDNPDDSGKEKCAKIAWGAVKKAGYKSSDESVASLEAMIASSNISRRITFGADTGIPIYNRFKAAPFGDSGDIKLIGTYLDFEGTTNGWHVDPAEEENITRDDGSITTVRIAHSKDPKEVVGKYEKFWGAEGDGCKDVYGNDLGRHIDFEAITNPQDPQLRTNILKGWVGDISPGLDAEVFCEVCGEAWGLDTENNKLIRSCEHQEAEGVLRNIKKKEGSIVTEPAFEGRTRFHPTFTFSMAMNQLFSPDECEPVATRPSEGQASHDGRQTSTGGKHMVSSKKDGTDGEFNTEQLEQFLKDKGYVRLKAEAEGEGEGEDQDEMGRVRAAYGIIKKFESKMAKLGWVKKTGEGEGESEADASAEGEGEGEGKSEAEGEGAYPYTKGEGDTTPPETGDTPKVTPGSTRKHPQDPYSQPGASPSIQRSSLSAENRKIVAEAQAYRAQLEAEKQLEEARSILAQKSDADKLNSLTAARSILEKAGDKEGVGRLDATIAELTKHHLEAAKKENSAQGAETPPAEINFSASQEIAAGGMPRFNAQAKTHFENSFKNEFWQAFKARSNQK